MLRRIFLATILVLCLFPVYSFGEDNIPTVEEQLRQAGFLDELDLVDVNTQTVYSLHQRLGFSKTDSWRTENFVDLYMVNKKNQPKILKMVIKPKEGAEDFFTELGGQGQATVKIEFDEAWLKQRKDIKVNEYSLVMPKIKKVWLKGDLKSIPALLHAHPPLFPPWASDRPDMPMIFPPVPLSPIGPGQ